MRALNIRIFTLYVFIGGALYHSLWMCAVRMLHLQDLSHWWHIVLLYVVPILLTVFLAQVTGVLGGKQASMWRWVRVMVLGIVVPLLALQLVGAVACVLTDECI